MDPSPTGIKFAPPPWRCECTAYAFAFFQPASSGLPHDVAYPPLEASSTAFSAESEAGTYRGGLCVAQIIRYSETPVGAYDEFALLPGYFDSPGGGKNTRITAIYVSQVDTCYNGRNNWNIPKHLARFTFQPLSPSLPLPLKITISPDTGNPFTFTIHPFPSLLSFTFPFSSSWVSYLGFNSTLVQPPLPQGAGQSKDIEVGTETWKASSPVLSSPGARGCWIDLRQNGVIEQDVRETRIEENWWPELGRWKLGLWLEDAVLTLGEPQEVKVKNV